MNGIRTHTHKHTRTHAHRHVCTYARTHPHPPPKDTHVTQPYLCLITNRKNHTLSLAHARAPSLAHTHLGTPGFRSHIQNTCKKYTARAVVSPARTRTPIHARTSLPIASSSTSDTLGSVGPSAILLPFSEISDGARANVSSVGDNSPVTYTHKHNTDKDTHAEAQARTQYTYVCIHTCTQAHTHTQPC